MPAYKDPRSGCWRYRTRITIPNGLRKRIGGTPSTNTKKAAEHAERAHVFREQNPSAIQTSQQREVPTVAEYVDIYLARYAAGKPRDVESKEQMLSANILKAFGGQRMDTIVQADVDRFVVSELQRIDPKTINNNLSVLGSMLRLAKKNRVIDMVDCDFFLKSEETDLVCVSQHDIERLLAVACPRYQAGILLACDAGLRVGEVRGVRWSDINEMKKELTVRQAFDTKGRVTSTKSRKHRKIPISDRLWSALTALPQQGETVLTLLSKPKPISYWAFRDGILRLYRVAEVKVPPLPWHCLRHSFCSHLADSKVPIHIIKELAGHASITTTLRYMHTNDEAKADAIGQAFGRKVNDVWPTGGQQPSPKKRNPPLSY